MRFAFLLCIAAVAALCIDQPDQFNTDVGPVKITPIYHASMIIEGSGRVIHVDPTSQANYKGLPKADLILITNDGPEHLDPAAIAKLSKKTTAIIAPKGPAPKLQHCTPLDNGETVSFGDISIQAVAAYNQAHPKGEGNGYVVTYPGLRIYISGDTGFIPEMKSIKNIEAAFISMGTPDTMSIEEAADALRAIKPKVVFPDHYRQTSIDDIKKQLAVTGTEVRMRYWY